LVWRGRYNIFNEPDIVKLKKLQWAGDVLHADDQRTMKTFNILPEGTWKVGRPKLRWKECVRQDIRTLGINNCRIVAMNREGQMAEAFEEGR
ncbi:hypothetical protein ANN_24685, partial [Periplaneta americana]